MLPPRAPCSTTQAKACMERSSPEFERGHAENTPDSNRRWLLRVHSCGFEGACHTVPFGQRHRSRVGLRHIEDNDLARHARGQPIKQIACDLIVVGEERADLKHSKYLSAPRLARHPESGYYDAQAENPTSCSSPAERERRQDPRCGFADSPCRAGRCACQNLCRETPVSRYTDR